MSWFRERRDELLGDARRAAGPAPRPGPGTRTDQDAGFWFRRMAQEAAVHRVDVESGYGAVTAGRRRRSRSTASTRCSTGSCPTRPRTSARTAPVAGPSRSAPVDRIWRLELHRRRRRRRPRARPGRGAGERRAVRALPLALGAPAGLGGACSRATRTCWPGSGPGCTSSPSSRADAGVRRRRRGPRRLRQRDRGAPGAARAAHARAGPATGRAHRGSQPRRDPDRAAGLLRGPDLRAAADAAPTSCGTSSTDESGRAAAAPHRRDLPRAAAHPGVPRQPGHVRRAGASSTRCCPATRCTRGSRRCGRRPRCRGCGSRTPARCGRRRAVLAQLRRAAAAGAELRHDEAVTGWTADG